VITIHQWVLSVPFPLRWLFASEPRVLGSALEVVTRAIGSYLVKKVGFNPRERKDGRCDVDSAIWALKSI